MIKKFFLIVLYFVLTINCSSSNKFVDEKISSFKELEDIKYNLSKLGIISRIAIGVSQDKNLALKKAKFEAQMQLYEYFEEKFDSLKFEILKDLGEYESYKKYEQAFNAIILRPDQRLLKIIEQSVIVNSRIKYDSKTNVYTAGILLSISNKKLCRFILERISTIWEKKYQQLIETPSYKKIKMECKGYFR